MKDDTKGNAGDMGTVCENAMGAVRILLVDDHPLTRDGLRLLLSQETGLSICGEAATLAEGLRLAAGLLPDLILLDLQLPDGSGLELLEEVGGWTNPPKVVVLSAADEGSAETIEAFRLGAVGFIGKPTPGDGVLAAVRAAVTGRPQLPDAIIAMLVRRTGERGARRPT